MVTTAPARILGLGRWGLTAGARADLVALECADPLLAVREVPPVAAVVRAGRLLPPPSTRLAPLRWESAPGQPSPLA